MLAYQAELGKLHVNCSDCIVLDLAMLRPQRVMLLFVTLIMKHGRWVTEKSKNLYIHENLASKLSVTKNMK